MSQNKANRPKKNTKGILWIALLLGILMPFGLYFALQNSSAALAVVFFVLLSAGFGITALQG